MLVLDNCQDAAGDTFHLILREACEELPQSTCLIALSRARLPDELARHAANQRVLNIAWDALRLTPDETRTIAKSNNERASTLHAQCDGWVAGLVLLLANNSATQGPTATSLQSKEALFAYFAGEVFARATPSAQEVLMRSALFPYTTIPMALEINDNNIAGEILNDLYAKHYFVERRAEGELTYQYHDLFRAFLLARLQASRAPEQLIALRERAAGILAAKGRWPDAVEQYQLANNWLEVRSLILGHAEERLDQGPELLIAPFLLGTSFANFDGYLPVVETLT